MSRIYAKQAEWPTHQNTVADHVNFIKDFPAFWDYWGKEESLLVCGVGCGEAGAPGRRGENDFALFLNQP